jgi:AraC-like DNA-binding protein
MPIHKYHEAAAADIHKVYHLMNTILPVSDELRRMMYENFVALDLPEGSMLINEGETCSYMYFIVKGALMAHSTHNKKKIITYISVENEFVSSISGMHGATPTKEGIIAVEPSSLIAFPNQLLLEMFEQQFDLNYIFRVIVQKYYQDAQERSHIIRVGNARERYFYFLQTKPGYIDRLPVEHIASLLDMKPQTLLRIRKQHTLSQKKDEETELLCKALEVQLQQKEVFRDRELNLSSLAAMLGVSTHRLSSLLNNQYQQNFVDHINRYRVNYIRQQLQVPDTLQQLTIEALSKHAGFSSRSAFYNAFRKVCGVSPMEYMQQADNLS